MDKNAIKKYAVWARNELIARVSQKAQQYGITAEGYGDKNADSVNGVLLSATEKKQRQALIAKIDAEGFEQVMEEVAYTWFNRFTALRFMEVNNYLPSHTRVFTNEANEFKPQILADAISLELEGLDMDKVFELKNANKDEELYKYLLIVQCNALSSILPGMFQKIADYSELLVPDYLLRENSIIEQMIRIIPEEDWTDQVEIIGWLYQAYNAEPKDERINAHRQYQKNDVPYVTQLFTPDWIVKYMVDNSLGKFWSLRNKESGFMSTMKYYLNSDVTHEKVENITPEKIRCIDPCAGSGHILCYLFDELINIYESYGYSSREAAVSIVENNIWGLDIDQRASQMAYFSIMMKARQYDRRFLSRNIQPNVYEIIESNGIDSGTIEYFAGNDNTIKSAISQVISEMKDAKEYGSILEITEQDWNKLYERANSVIAEGNMFSILIENTLLPIIRVAEALSQKYAIVVTNPPYMNASVMPGKLKTYVQDNYSDYKTDMFSVMMVRAIRMCMQDGFVGMLTPYVWMFITSYEKLRNYIINNTCITSMVQLEYNAFEAACVPVAAFTLEKSTKKTKGDYIRLSEFRGAENQGPKTLEAIADPACGYRFSANQETYNRIPGSPIAYWVSENYQKMFSKKTMGKVGKVVTGMTTAGNDDFLRLWFEVEIGKLSKADDIRKWVPYQKGGDFRKWYGNNDYVVNWENDGYAIKHNIDAKTKKVRSGSYNGSYAFRSGISWTYISSGDLGVRYVPTGFMFDNKGSMVFFENDEVTYLALAFLCSSVANNIAYLLNPTISFQPGNMATMPFPEIDEKYKESIIALAKENIRISKTDWDQYETSMDFEVHPFIRLSRTEKINLLKDIFLMWEKECNTRFENLRINEQKINELLIETYGLDNELDAAVEDKNVSVRKASLQEDIKSFISYIVGCLFGRYSLDEAGIVCADAKYDPSRYISFIPDADGIIPICDDEYFEDDAVGQIVSFIAMAFGKEALEDNLRFIANALGGKGTSREIIRDYLLNGFFVDHCSRYAVTGSGKRPIYWQFDSGKKNGFKCLVYMHRYQPDTIARIRTDYVHEQQSRYRTALADLEQRINGASTSERVKLNKQLKTIQDQAEELRKYEEKIHHLADQMISIDLDDGVKENYAKFQDVLAKIK